MNKPLTNKHHLDKYLLETFIPEERSHPNFYYKIENGKVEFTLFQFPRFGNIQTPDGFTPLTKDSYAEIVEHLNDGFIFSKPIASNLIHDLFRKIPNRDNEIETELFKHSLSKFGINVLKEMQFTLIPKKVNLHNYEDLFDHYRGEQSSGREIFMILKEIPLTGHYFDNISKAFKKAFAFIDKTVENMELSDHVSLKNEDNIPAYLLSKKEDLIKSFMEKNPKFIDKGPNKVWFGNMISELESNLDIKKLLGKEEIPLFETDTWKHVTVELSKHGLYQNYPLKTTLSSYNAQSIYKSTLSQFSTFIASNDKRLGWGLNIEQAHLVTKKNGNYLFSLSHSSLEPDTEKFKKILKSFLDYLKPSFISEEDTVTKAVGEVFGDKDKLKKIMSNVVLYNDMQDTLIDSTSNKKRNKL